ncbi:hypothetical protein THASP1DRAFT_33530 [Thamnocephalis sphaerospora]|uniref:Uncharacterized protein n=1 Tax=Thamnocephalis sphaerospora TaxID=78915 RepID=A0A4P9XGC7_9FUNG|nr:hypothetical protein THASP1DRAFT_33530 [Thamnocephalis sphaerospora]|eukprot:RKP04674.1 hypothetical protein THASP1DRAFT_33530 [Thamnocephalis sphaerospora]
MPGVSRPAEDLVGHWLADVRLNGAGAHIAQQLAVTDASCGYASQSILSVDPTTAAAGILDLHTVPWLTASASDRQHQGLLAANSICSVMGTGAETATTTAAMTSSAPTAGDAGLASSNWLLRTGFNAAAGLDAAGCQSVPGTFSLLAAPMTNGGADAGAEPELEAYRRQLREHREEVQQGLTTLSSTTGTCVAGALTAGTAPGDGISDDDGLSVSAVDLSDPALLATSDLLGLTADHAVADIAALLSGSSEAIGAVSMDTGVGGKQTPTKRSSMPSIAEDFDKAICSEPAANLPRSAKRTAARVASIPDLTAAASEAQDDRTVKRRRSEPAMRQASSTLDIHAYLSAVSSSWPKPDDADDKAGPGDADKQEDASTSAAVAMLQTGGVASALFVDKTSPVTVETGNIVESDTLATDKTSLLLLAGAESHPADMTVADNTVGWQNSLTELQLCESLFASITEDPQQL